MKTTPTLAAVAALAALAALPSLAAAQRPVRRQAPIEIRGQVPTPQVTTVRPREVPAYDRRVLVPDFYDHNFWQSILPAYQLVSARVITGATVDTTSRAAMPAAPGAPAPTTTPPGAAPAAGTPPGTPPAGAPPARPAGSTPGTAPATSPR